MAKALPCWLGFFLLSACVQLQPGGIEQFIPRDSEGFQLVRHENYLLGYDEESEQAAWVLYELRGWELEGQRWKRKDNFRADPEVATGSAELTDYRRSGYDRGHLAPAADMAFSEEAMSESFFLSNMSPQKPSFNRGIWRELEALVRDWAKDYQRIIVVTAGVLTGELSENLPRIGENEVWVPNYYYKIVYDPQRQVMIAFLLKNEGSKEDLSHFVISVDELEDLTDIDFFAQLPDWQEEEMESQPADLNDWQFEF